MRRKTSAAVTMPVMKRVMKKVQPLSANWSEPLIPLPLVQPSAIRH